MNSKMNRYLLMMLFASLPLLLVACGDDEETDDGPNEVVVPDTYTYESRFEEGVSSVSYSGQVARQVLISDLNDYISDLSNQIDSGTFMPAADGDVVAALDFYFRFDSAANGETDIRLTAGSTLMQTTYNSISTDKDLVGKLAGNDTVTDHKDWSMAFSGWSDDTIAQYGGGITTPEGLVTAYFETIEENAIARANGTLRTAPDGQTLPVYVTESGLDLKQLTQKFLLGSVNLSQGADDYLDDDVDGKGLLSDNTGPDDGDPYTALEHQWDEGFGYFGAARNYGDLTLGQIADEQAVDADGDGVIDLNSEYNFGASTNAAKRDRGANVSEDFTGRAFEAFRRGRAIISAADGALTEEQLNDLRAARDEALLAWEGALAATVVHYINDTLQVMNAFDTDDYDFLEHAKVWSEMKGFALGFQFNPHSPLTDMQFTQLHGLIGDAPVLEAAGSEDIDAYRADLLSARDLIMDAYGFNAENAGDDNGEGGW